MGEAFNKRPIFVSDSSLKQLWAIFKICGTPNDLTWPGVSQLREFRQDWP